MIRNDLHNLLHEVTRFVAIIRDYFMTRKTSHHVMHSGRSRAEVCLPKGLAASRAFIDAGVIGRSTFLRTMKGDMQLLRRLGDLLEAETGSIGLSFKGDLN